MLRMNKPNTSSQNVHETRKRRARVNPYKNWGIEEAKSSILIGNVRMQEFCCGSYCRSGECWKSLNMMRWMFITLFYNHTIISLLIPLLSIVASVVIICTPLLLLFQGWGRRSIILYFVFGSEIVRSLMHGTGAGVDDDSL